MKRSPTGSKICMKTNKSTISSIRNQSPKVEMIIKTSNKVANTYIVNLN